MEQIGDIRWKAFYFDGETHLCRMRLEYISPKRKSFHYRLIDGPLEGSLRKYGVYEQPFETPDSALYDYQRQMVVSTSGFCPASRRITTIECVERILEAEDMKRRTAISSGDSFIEQTQSMLGGLE